jgi:hypothetical protein
MEDTEAPKDSVGVAADLKFGFYGAPPRGRDRLQAGDAVLRDVPSGRSFSAYDSIVLEPGIGQYVTLKTEVLLHDVRIEGLGRVYIHSTKDGVEFRHSENMPLLLAPGPSHRTTRPLLGEQLVLRRTDTNQVVPWRSLSVRWPAKYPGDYNVRFVVHANAEDFEYVRLHPEFF